MPNGTPTVSPTYTPEGGALQGRIESLTRAVSEGYKMAPTVRESLARSVAAEEGMIEPLAEERGNLISQLFEIDKGLAQKYAAPESEMYIEDPMARERAISGRESALWGALSRLNALIGTRRAMMGDVISRGLDIYTAGLKAQEAELENAWKQLQRIDEAEKEKRRREEWEAEYALKVAELGRKGREETEAERKRRVTSELAIDVQKGTTLADTMRKYGTELSPDEILQVYNLYSPYGPAKETPEELSRRFGVKAVKPTAAQEKTKKEVDTAEAIYRQIEKESKGKALGRVKGAVATLGKAAGLYPELTAYDALRKASIGPLARAISGEVGVLTDRDIARAEGLLPKITDTPEEREAKLRLFRQAIDEKKMASEGVLHVRLMNPATGEVFEYDSETDPDYLEDLGRGFVPQ